MAEQVTIAGLQDLLSRLEALPREVTSRNGGLVRTALGRAARLLRDEAESRVPVRTGALKKNIYAYRDRDPGRSAPGASERYIVGVRGGAVQRINTRKVRRQLARLNARGDAAGVAAVTAKARSGPPDTFYWRFVEFGTAKMRAQPFLRPALETRAADAIREFESSLSKGIDRVVARLARQGRGR